MMKKLIIGLAVIGFLSVSFTPHSVFAGGQSDTEKGMWIVGALMIFIPIVINAVLEHREEPTQNENKEEPVKNEDQNDEEKITSDETVTKDKIVTPPSQTVAIFEW